jgi:membrane fusion protein, multidrug efflux system
MTERFGQMEFWNTEIPGRDAKMYRDRTESAGELTAVTDRPAWQNNEVARPAAKGPDSPVGPAPARQQPETAKPVGPLVAQEAAAAPAKPKRGLSRKTIALVALLAALAGGGWYGHYYWTAGRYLVSTDDAYVGAKNTTLAAKVSGYVDAVVVDDNAQVHAGDVIAKIDDGDYRLAVDSARNKVATQQATIERIGKQVEAQQAAIDQAKAQLVSAQAGATRADLELARQQALAVRDYASKQALEAAQASKDQSRAAVAGARAAVEAAQANVGVLKAQQEEAARTLKELETALAKAERDLSFTVIRAPMNGVVGNRAMQVGDYVQPGQRLASIVPLDAVYVDANFKETQLARLKPGQPVKIAVDAFGGDSVNGTVVSVAPASGSVFSLLPPDNATGNFTKIVQRVPVRIQVPLALAEKGALRSGTSVVVTIDTRPGAVATEPVRTAANVMRAR